MSQPTIESVIEEVNKETDKWADVASYQKESFKKFSYLLSKKIADLARSEERKRCVEIVERYYPEVKDSLADNVAVLSIYKEITNNKKYEGKTKTTI